MEFQDDGTVINAKYYDFYSDFFPRNNYATWLAPDTYAVMGSDGNFYEIVDASGRAQMVAGQDYDVSLRRVRETLESPAVTAIVSLGKVSFIVLFPLFEIA